MNVQLYKLPILDKKFIFDIENVYCEIYNKKRNGDQIDIEILDWFDSANTFLKETDNERS